MHSLSQTIIEFLSQSGQDKTQKRNIIDSLKKYSTMEELEEKKRWHKRVGSFIH